MEPTGTAVWEATDLVRVLRESYRQFEWRLGYRTTAVVKSRECLHSDTVQFLSIALNSAAPTSANTINTSHSTLTESIHIVPLCPLSHPSYLFTPSSASLSPTSRSVLFLSGISPNHAPSTDSAAPSTNPNHPPTSILIHSRSRMCRLCDDRNTKWTLHTMRLVNWWHGCYPHS